MAAHDPFELKNGYAIFRPEGHVTIPEDAVALFRQAMIFCHERAITRLLVDARGLIHEPITTVDRFRLWNDVANFWDRRILFEVLARHDQRDPNRFGELVAGNRAMPGSSHETESEAIAALLARR